MEMKALKFRLDGSEVRTAQCDLFIGTPEDLERLKEDVLPVVYVVRLDALDGLRKFTESVIDRKTKNPNKGLSHYLLNQPKDRIPIIDGNFGDSGQAKRSIRDFLKNAAKAEDLRPFIIGMADRVFAQLHGGGDPGASAGSGDRSQHGTSSRQTDDYRRESMRDADYQFYEELKRSNIQICKHAERYVGNSYRAELVRMLITRAAMTNSPVLIIGDTGTGKEVVARAIHDCSVWLTGDFVPVNCGGIPRAVFESELFGHIKGAFTGAIRDKEGLWETANNGTLFLDEIGDLPVDDQVKILRALADGKIRRVGGIDEMPVNARVIAATNRDLFGMVQRGRFREDLYYRLIGLFINTPALRDHREDIPLLAQYFWETIKDKDRNPLPQEVLDMLMRHQWPGNSKELQMVLKHLNSLFKEDDLTAKHVRLAFRYAGQNASAHDNSTSDKAAEQHIADCIRHLRKTDTSISAAGATVAPILKERRSDDEVIKRMRGTLPFDLADMEILCQTPLLFHSELTYSAVSRLKDRLARFQKLLEGQVADAQKYCDEILGDEFRAATSAIFKEMEKMTGRA